MGDSEMMSRAGILPILNHYHVNSVTLPNYNFKKENQMYGPLARSMPIMDYDGLEISITFEEDAYGTVGYFLNTMQQRSISQDGLYIAPNEMKLDTMMVQIENDVGAVVGIYTFKDVYFLKADISEFNYSSNETVKYNAVFNADYYSVKYPITLAKGVVNRGKNVRDIKDRRNKK